MAISTLIKSFAPMAAKMLSQSGGWDTCPFCDSTNGAGDDVDETAWHKPDCILREFAKEADQMENNTTEVPVTETTDTSNPAGLVLEPPATLVKLDLGAGQNPRGGFEGVDLHAPNPAHRVDLFKFPWPFADDSVDEIHCSHFIEHIPNREVESRDASSGATAANWDEYIGKDMLFAFFDECWRILKHDGWLTLIWPCSRSDRAFQDPTHRRYIPLATMPYMSREWRKSQGLDHYKVKCHFGGDLNYIADQKLNLLSDEAKEKPINNYWNTILDFQSKMKAIKR